MRKLRNYLIGIDQGEENLFSDFDVNGEMWTGTGKRERRKKVQFSEHYRVPPNVMVNLAMWDADSNHNMRADVQAEKITETGFEIVFKTWGDTRVARARVSWQAIGECHHKDDWTLY